MARKKDPYTHFRKYLLSEEEFRRHWGKSQEITVEAMVKYRELAETARTLKDKRKYKKEADRLYLRATTLTDVFVSLKDFRIDDSNKEV